MTSNKGIALFTPAGDVIYSLSSCKFRHWHLNLCLRLQELLGLPEPPHFLIPGYTATLDRWREPKTGQLQTFTIVYPAVRRYQPLLNALFATEGLVWQVAPWQEESCNPILLETYRPHFPQLWQNHQLIVRLQEQEMDFEPKVGQVSPASPTSAVAHKQGYLLRLFVSGNNRATQSTFKTIHQLLEKHLQHPYSLKVIDISKHPEQAELNQVAATPTLVRVWPEPVRRIVGELEDVRRFLQIIIR
jgi:circadian clock protein KaiB